MPCELTLPVDPVTNHLTDAVYPGTGHIAYDTLGQVHEHDAWTYVWDAAGMMTRAYTGPSATPSASTE